MDRSLNRIELRGNVGQDARINRVGDNTVVRFNMATNENVQGPLRQSEGGDDVALGLGLERKGHAGFQQYPERSVRACDRPAETEPLHYG